MIVDETPAARNDDCPLERFPVRWNHLTDKKSLFFQRSREFSRSQKSATFVENALIGRRREDLVGYALTAYIQNVDFEFDSSKSDRNLRERGFDFAYAARVFQGRIAGFVDDRQAYGEVRMVAIGEIDGKLFTVIYTDREDVRRIISAHRSSRQEERKWQQSE